MSELITEPSISGKSNKRRKDLFKDANTAMPGNNDGNEDLKKKMRTTFTGKQIFELEKSFESKKYLSSAERAEIATSLDVTQQQVREGLKAYISSDCL